MSPERELLTQKSGKAQLIFETGLGAFIMKEIFGFFLGDASCFTDGAIDAMVENWFIKKVAEEGEIVQGDVRDITNKSIGMQRITLTDQNFYLLYSKGFRKKKQKVLALPLKYAEDVEIKGTILKNVVISFEVPLKEQKKTAFQLSLRVFLPDVWLNTIKCAIAEYSADKSEEKVFGCIDISKRGHHGLYFTKDRVIVARSGTSSLATVVALFVCYAGFLVVCLTFITRVALFLPLGLGMVIMPISLTFAANKRKHKELLKMKPNDILANDKKNFEIPYDQITHLELKKFRIGSYKARILTKSENYSFGILNKKLLKYHKSLVQWVLPESKLILPEIKEKKLPQALQ